MFANEAYKIFDKTALFKELRREGFVIEDNQVNYPLKKKPKKCLRDFTFAGEIIGDKYLVVNTFYKEGSCWACKRAISKLQKLAR
jgi:hypothetical protein